MITNGILGTGGSLPLHPRLREHGMTRDHGRVVGSVRAGMEVIALSIERLTAEEKSELRAQLLKGRS